MIIRESFSAGSLARILRARSASLFSHVLLSDGELRAHDLQNSTRWYEQMFNEAKAHESNR